jgi:hypothetical protein
MKPKRYRSLEIYKNVPIKGDFQGYCLTLTMFRYTLRHAKVSNQILNTEYKIAHKAIVKLGMCLEAQQAWNRHSYQAFLLQTRAH